MLQESKLETILGFPLLTKGPIPMLKDWFQFETYNMSTTSQIQLGIEEKKMANEEKAE